MIITKELLEARIAMLDREEDECLARANAIVGMRDQCRMLLEVLEKQPPEPEKGGQ